MKRRIRTAVTTLTLALVAVPWALGWIRYDYGFVDAQVAFYFVTEAGTLYGDGYSEGGFRSVLPGMTREEVRGLLGEPIVRPWFQGPHGDPSEWWYAFQGEPGNNAHLRCVTFGPDDRVTGKISEPRLD